jgi:hypothetical protein
MSVATRRALYGKLSGDVTLNALLGTPATGYSKSIYYQLAPQGANFPCVILSKQAGTPRYALGERAYDNDVWLIKGVDKNLSGDPVDNVASRLDALLTDGTISISGRTQLYLRRESDIDYSEVVDGTVYRHAGSNYRLLYA